MNLPAKVCLGAGAFLVMSGGLLAITGFALGAQTGLDLHLGSNGVQVESVDSVKYSGEWSDGDYQDLAPFTNLDVDLSLGDVTVATGEGYGISLSGELAADLSYELNGDTLQVRGSDGGSLSGWDHQVSAVIYLPEEASLDSAVIRTDMGDLDLEDFTAQTLTVGSGLGDVYLWDVEAVEAEVRLSMGDLTTESFTTEQSLTVENDMGDVQLDGAFRGETDCTLSMGDLELYTAEPEDAYGLNFNVSMGELYLDGSTQRGTMTSPGGPNTLTVTSGMGDVYVSFG